MSSKSVVICNVVLDIIPEESGACPRHGQPCPHVEFHLPEDVDSGPYNSFHNCKVSCGIAEYSCISALQYEVQKVKNQMTKDLSDE